MELAAFREAVIAKPANIVTLRKVWSLRKLAEACMECATTRGVATI